MAVKLIVITTSNYQNQCSLSDSRGSDHCLFAGMQKINTQLIFHKDSYSQGILCKPAF